MRPHITLALLLLLGIAPLHAQAPRDSSRARAINALHLGSQLRLVAAGHEYFGELVARDSIDIALDHFGSRFTVPRMEIQALWQPKGRATKDGFIIGGILGAISGGALGWVAGGIFCESGCTSKAASGAIIGGAAGGLIVGAVGAVIGSAFTNWEQRFP